MPSAPTLILASSSPYRQQLLERLGMPFVAIAPNLDESPLLGETPKNLTLRLAQAKAQAIASLHRNAWVIGSDQSADLNGHMIGKPGSHAAALAQLKQMQGQAVVFHTSLCLIGQNFCKTIHVPTTVQFRNLPEQVLDQYLRLEKPYDCAGSAKSEGMGIILLEKIESEDPTALIGLPLIALTSLFLEAGISLPATQDSQ
ncbi:Maf-like protein [Polynucleobacter sp. HIN9]|uniref:Maf family nucleotide pyrophosphatase n=1 Tax=Polynucleobacter sp. HIN9 TaxID=3047868 RepID=UPI00257489B9|nr:Maf family nucleotide pyrophosphatase [Polynucleobacter sp. HIN9]BEI40523.1 Maf-like protein [Polynucleobacter sp. HIN9]